MKTIFNIQNGMVTLLCTAVFAGLTACDAGTVEREGGKLPDREPLETTYGMLRSSSAADRTIDVLLTEGGNGFVVRNFYFQQTKPASDKVSIDAWVNAALLDSYTPNDEIERELLPETNYEFLDGNTMDLSPETQCSALKRIRFTATGLAAGEYILPLTVAEKILPMTARLCTIMLRSASHIPMNMRCTMAMTCFRVLYQHERLSTLIGARLYHA